MMVLEIAIGLFGAVGLIVFARQGSTRREVFVYTIGLVIAALVYVVFAALRGGPKDFGVEALGFMAFSLVAALGWRLSPLVIGAGWLLHVAWDVLLHPVAAGGYASDWYPVVCIGFDLLLAGYIFVRFGKGLPDDSTHRSPPPRC
jgi:hypothetical protein